MGIKSQLSGSTVRLALFLGNKAAESLTQVGHRRCAGYQHNVCTSQHLERLASQARMPFALGHRTI